MKRLFALFLTTLLLGGSSNVSHAQADPIRDGQALAKELRSLQMGIPGSIKATMKIRKRDGSRIEHRVNKHTQTFENGWRDIFQVDKSSSDASEWLWIDHRTGASPDYKMAISKALPTAADAFKSLDSEQVMTPLGESDFWVADLGLDFLHWPDQRTFTSKITRRKGVGCKLLESSRPTRSSEGYYKVRSWISTEHLGVVYAEAFDIQDQKIKTFEVNGVEKINGHHHLKQLRIRNMREKSTSVLEFDYSGLQATP